MARGRPVRTDRARATFEHVQRLTRASLRDLVLSRSYCAVRTPEERASVLDAVDTLFEEHAVDAEIALPYFTRCLRVVRPERASLLRHEPAQGLPCGGRPPWPEAGLPARRR